MLISFDESPDFGEFSYSTGLVPLELLPNWPCKKPAPELDHWLPLSDILGIVGRKLVTRSAGKRFISILTESFSG